MKFSRFFWLSSIFYFAVINTTFASITELEQLLAPYRKAEQIELTGTRTTTLAVMDSKQEFNTKIFISSNGKFRMQSDRTEGKQKENALVVFDGKQLWMQQTDSSSKKPSVSKMSLSAKAKNQLLISKIFSEKNIAKFLKVETYSNIEQIKFFGVKLIETDLQISNVRLVFDKFGRIKTISYLDEIENSTEFNFTKSAFKKKADSQKYKYSPPKGVTVTELR